jgi:2-polyprenyl-3-methyl-5-hydroxy-6-metoxy-1,4-benzoquinol methylase
MSQCQCQGIETVFDSDTVEKQLRRLHTRGPQKTTRLLVEALRGRGVAGKTLLDIGGGVGAIQHMLLASDVASVTGIDASSAYLEAARAEAVRLGFGDKVRFQHGNFVDLAEGTPSADIVTLDRVICCYDDMGGLVSSSAAKTRDVYGLVFPRNSWIARIGVAVANFTLRIRRNPFRIFTHSTQAVEAILRGLGLHRVYHRASGIWQVAVYVRHESGRFDTDASRGSVS